MSMVERIEYIEYDPYWREPAKRCRSCDIMKGVSQYGKSRNKRFGLQPSCRRCTNEKSRKQWLKRRENYNPIRKVRKERDREKHRAWARQWYAKNIERLRAERREYERSRRRCGKDPGRRYRRSMRGRFCLLARYIMLQYGFHATSQELYERFNTPEYRSIYMKWQTRKWRRDLAPTLMLKTPELRRRGFTDSLDDFILITVGNKLSIEHIENNIGKPDGGWKREKDGKFKRTTKVLCQERVPEASPAQ